MDTLDVLRKAEQMGGSQRRDAIQDVVVAARDLGCDFTVGGGKVGGLNIRYGTVQYAVMDIRTDGTVLLHIKPHPGKDISDEDRREANEFLESLEGLTVKNMPVNNYGTTEEPVEEIPTESLEHFLSRAVDYIRQNYY